MQIKIEEAIKKCRQIIIDNNEIIKETRKNGDINAIQLTASLDNDSIAIELVLNELEKKNKIIKQLETEQKIDFLLEQQEEREKYTHSLEEKLEKKNKIINEMAKHIEKHSTAYPQLYGANAEEWKEYFTNKVEKEGK